MDEPALEPTPLSEFPERAFETPEGEGWLARVTGRSAIGHAPSGGAVMMHLSFSKRDAPDTVARETLVPCESLDDLSESELVRLLGEAAAPPESTADDGDSNGRREAAR